MRTAVLVGVVAVMCLAAGCKLPAGYGGSSGGGQSQAAIPDETGLRARVAGYWAAAATGNGPAMWPFMLGSVANGGEKEFYSRTDLPPAPAQVRIAKIESASVHADIWGVKPQALVHVNMEANVNGQWVKLKQVDTWYLMNGQWYLGMGM